MTSKKRLRGKQGLASMEETIGVRMLAVGLVTMAVTAIMMMLLFYHVLDTQVRRDLQMLAQVAVHITDSDNESAIGALFEEKDARLTLIEADGTVLYESLPDAQPENHAQRPEVVEAKEKGEGFAKRESQTSGYDTYYYAMRTKDGRILRTALDARSFFSLYQETIPAAILCFVLVLVLSTGAAVLVTKRIVKPIEQMGRGMGQGAIRAPYRELCAMAQALETERGLRDENENMRREFTANVSHELKTPLTSISGYAEMIEAGIARPEDIPDFAGRIKREAARLLALIGDILELSMLESPALVREFHPERISLSKAAAQTSERLQMNAQKAYVTLLCDVEKDVFIQADARLMDELLQNLTDNAIRYNRPGGRVTVRVHQNTEEAALTVEDNGIGIAPEHQAHVFERFYRADKSRSKATGGTGLGLAIVKHIAILHNAQIELESKPEHGTKITVHFNLYKE